MLESFEIMFLTFFIYSFFGWFMETILGWIDNKKFVNRGFLIGPYCPIYGIGCILITTLLKRYLNDPLVLFILAAVICSILEYITSYLMEKIYKARWWDYSNVKFNINGRICLTNSFLFGGLAFLIMYFVNPSLQNLLLKFPTSLLNILTYLLMFILFVDLFLSLNIMSRIKSLSFELKKDNTAEITKKVKEILQSGDVLAKRINEAFPNLQSTLKSKRQELEEKRMEILTKLRKNYHFSKYVKIIEEKKYKMKGDNNEE